MKKLIVILGAQATGKDTVARYIKEKFNIPIAVSYTDRPMRTSETQGAEYYFINQKEMDKKFENNEVLESTSYYIQSEDRTYRYASTVDELTKSEYVIVVMNPIGLYQLQQTALKDKLVTILLKSNDRDRLYRALDRDENVNVHELFDRLIRDELDFGERCPKTDYVIENNAPLSVLFDKIDKIIKEILEGECLC